jgi:transcriptional regulator with XRE-family HTH domain
VPTRNVPRPDSDSDELPDPTRLAIGRALRQARESAGLSGRELGARLGLAAPAAQARYSRAENGLHPLAADELVHYAHACNTSARRILELAGVDWIDGEQTSDPVMLAISTDPSIRSDLKPVARANIAALRDVPAAPPRAGGSPSFDELLSAWSKLTPENQATFLAAIEVQAVNERTAARRKAKNGKRAVES